MGEIKIEPQARGFETEPWDFPVKAVIFDMDGLMIDSESDHYVAFWQALSRYGVFLGHEEHIEVNVGKSDLMGAQGLLAKYRLIDPEDKHIVTAEELVERKQAAYEEIVKGKTPDMRPGLMELLHALQANGFQMAIASGSTKREIKAVIDALDLGRFFGQNYYSAEEVERGKPHPDLFRYAARKLGVKNRECLVLEDGRSGIEAATRAKMHRYVIPSTETGNFRNDFRNAERELHSLAEVMNYLRIDSPRSFQ